MIVLPTVKPGQLILIRSRKDSGIILNNDNSFYLSAGNDYYRIFDTLEEMRNFIGAEKQVNDSFEYLIYDHHHSLIEHIDKLS